MGSFQLSFCLRCYFRFFRNLPVALHANWMLRYYPPAATALDDCGFGNISIYQAISTTADCLQPSPIQRGVYAPPFVSRITALRVARFRFSP
jgi:hypothetical protein